jgi:sugar lactone lactonase YvrE
LLDYKCELGEGPVWDAHNNRLLWIDILKGDIHQYYFNTDEHRTFNINEFVGSIALRKTGTLVAAVQHGFVNIDLDRGTVQRIANTEADLPNNRFNDGKCDPDGRFWAGTMSLRDEAGAGALYTLDKDHSISKKIDGVSISNGLAWSIDGNTLYYVDTPSYSVVAYEYDGTTGNISNKRTAISVHKDFGDPDGMTIDTEGMLWIAHWDGWQITRWDPTTGELLSQVKLPVSRVTCCIFGGSDLNDLFITSASTGLTAEQLVEQPLAGSVFIIKNCGHTGVLPDQFAG